MIRAVLTVLALAPIAAAPASAAGWADDEAQAGACEKTLELMTAGKIDEAIDTIFLEAQPWDAQAAKTRPDYEKLADSMRGFLRAGLESVHK